MISSRITLSGSKLLALLISSALLMLPPAADAKLAPADNGLEVLDTTNDQAWTSNATLMAAQAASFSGGASAFVSAVIADSGGVIHDTPNSYDPSGTYTLSAGDFNVGAGTMDWWGAQAWVNYLNVTHYGGSNQWALPTTADILSSYGYPGGSGPSVASSQLAQLIYAGLGEVAATPFGTAHNGNYSLFTNLQNSTFWSGTQYSLDPNFAWGLDTLTGLQIGFNKQFYDLDALAVAPLDAAPVPLPTTALLLLSGLGSLGALLRSGGVCGDRTHDQRIKSPMLYRLS
jgi:hypothetical protein